MEQPTEGGKRSKWMAHVKQTMKAHKGKSLSQVLKLAAKTYKKSGGAALSPADYSSAGPAAPTKGGRRRGRSTRRNRKH